MDVEGLSIFAEFELPVEWPLTFDDWSRYQPIVGRFESELMSILDGAEDDTTGPFVRDLGA
ncbi:MAG: hypothetical protein DMG14_18700 [Acidobacteria bacterium]|nr:MAG: hypothetical protein DMG14_18700 [Acidobacteriota bacterium]